MVWISEPSQQIDAPEAKGHYINLLRKLYAKIQCFASFHQPQPQVN